MLAKHELTIFDPDYGRLARLEKDAIWDEALEVLGKEKDVILDWSLWSRRARAECTANVVRSGHEFKLFYFPVPLNVLN